MGRNPGGVWLSDFSSARERPDGLVRAWSTHEAIAGRSPFEAARYFGMPTGLGIRHSNVQYPSPIAALLANPVRVFRMSSGIGLS